MKKEGNKTINKKILLLLPTILVLLSLVSVAQALPAFPGAAGFGSTTPGGRGGDVIKVTNLNDNGPGSLRAALTASGARIVVFETGGTIDLSTDIYIINPFITIAGQTAPGDGIAIKGATIHVWTHDVIIRGLRIRPGDEPGPSCDGRDAIGIGNGSGEWMGYHADVYNVIVDHCSFSWGTDEVAGSWYSPYDFTYQYNIISEPLNDSCHSKGPHAYCMLIGQTPSNVSVHHNLFAHCQQRAPLFTQLNTIGENLELINNVIYNWNWHGTDPQSPNGVDIIKNYYKAGPNTYVNPPYYRRGVTADYEYAYLIYVLGNIGPERPTDSGSEWLVVNNDADEADHRSYTRTCATTNVVIDSANDAYTKVLDEAGAYPYNRDSVDIRVVNHVQTGTGAIINSQNDVGGWPTLAEGIPPLDTDSDGMPNNWEVANGLDPNDPGDGNNIAPSGYTWVEEYINSLIVFTSSIFSIDPYLGDANNWEPLTPSRWEVLSDMGDLRYGIITTNYENLSGSRLGEYSLVKDRIYENFIFNATVRSTDDFVSNPSADYDIIFGYQDPDNYYYMMFSSNPVNSDIFKIVNGQRELIADSGSLAVPDNNYHDVALERSGNNIRVFFDGSLVLETQDSTFGSGRIGIGSFNDASLWDDILIITGTSCSQADTNSDNIVSMVELMSYISDWKAGSVTMVNLMTAIGEWKNGCS